MKIRPLQDRVIVERIARRGEDQGRNHHPRYREGKAAGGENRCRRQGEGERRRQAAAADVKEGDKILFGKYSGTEVKSNGNEYLIMREDDILGIVEA